MKRSILLVGLLLLCLWSLSDAGVEFRDVEFREPAPAPASEQGDEEYEGDADADDPPTLQESDEEVIGEVKAIFSAQQENVSFSRNGMAVADGVSTFTRYSWYPVSFYHNGRGCCDVKVSGYTRLGWVFYDYGLRKWCRHYNWWYRIPQTHCTCDEGCASRYGYRYAWSNIIRPQACRPVAWTWRYSWAYCYSPYPATWRLYRHYIITRCDCRPAF